MHVLSFVRKKRGMTSRICGFVPYFGLSCPASCLDDRQLFLQGMNIGNRFIGVMVQDADVDALFPSPHILSRPMSDTQRSHANHEDPRHPREPPDDPEYHAQTTQVLSSKGQRTAVAETEVIDLADYRIIPCTACEACTLNGICVNDDNLPALFVRMKEADAIVFGSPVYIDNITGQMKVFFNRLAGRDPLPAVRRESWLFRCDHL